MVSTTSLLTRACCAAVAMLALGACKPSVTPPEEESSTSGTTQIEASSSGGLMSAADWRSHCESISGEAECTEQRASLANQSAGSCVWLRWRSIAADGEGCSLTEPIEEECRANVFGGDGEPSPVCEGSFVCARGSGDEFEVSVQASPCGGYDACLLDEPLCACACEEA